MQRLVRFARYWDLIANSGRFANTLPLVLGDAPFARFMDLSDWLYARTDATHRIALERLAALVAQWLRERGHEAGQVTAVMERDYAGQVNVRQAKAGKERGEVANPRQARHMAA